MSKNLEKCIKPRHMGIIQKKIKKNILICWERMQHYRTQHGKTWPIMWINDITTWLHAVCHLRRLQRDGRKSWRCCAMSLVSILLLLIPQSLTYFPLHLWWLGHVTNPPCLRTEVPLTLMCEHLSLLPVSLLCDESLRLSLWSLGLSS